MQTDIINITLNYDIKKTQKIFKIKHPLKVNPLKIMTLAGNIERTHFSSSVTVPTKTMKKKTLKA